MTDKILNEWRKAVEDKLNRKIPNVVWKEIITTEGEFFETTALEKKEINKIIGITINELKKFNRYYGGVPRIPKTKKMLQELPQQKESQLLPEIIAHSKIIACLLNEEENILKFRQEVLNDSLLLPAEVQSWVKSVAEREGVNQDVLIRFPVSVNLDALVGDEIAPAVYLDNLVRTALKYLPSAQKEGTCGIGFETSFLSIPSLSGHYAETIPINNRGVLARLHHLAKQYKDFWTEAAAVNFILTGEYSLVHKASAHYGCNGQGIPFISLKVNPSLSGDEVRSLYLRARKGFGNWPGVTSAKGLIEKHLKLAVFTVEQDGSWRTKLEKWNKKHPNWKYSDSASSTFARDCRAAYKRLTGWEWKQ